MLWAFTVWLGLVTRTGPRAQPVPYLPQTSARPPKKGRRAPRTAVPPYISGRTSYLRVRLEFLPYPQVIPRFCNTGGFGPRRGLTPASPCPWVAHPVSGLMPATPPRLAVWAGGRRALFRRACPSLQLKERAPGRFR